MIHRSSIAQSKLRNVLGLLVFTAACEPVPLELGSRYVRAEVMSVRDGGNFAVTEQEAPDLAGVSIDVPGGALERDILIGVAPGDPLAPEDGVARCKH